MVLAHRAATALTLYAVATRYPGEWEPGSQDEPRWALDIAAQGLAWVAMPLDGLGTMQIGEEGPLGQA